MPSSARKGEISISALRRLFERAGAERVGGDAVLALGKAIEEYAVRVGKEAVALAKHAKRRTVKAIDIELAVKSLE